MPAFGRHPGRGEDARAEVHKPLRESRIVINSGVLSSARNEKAREQRRVRVLQSGLHAREWAGVGSGRIPFLRNLFSV